MVRLIAALPRVVRSGRPPPRLADVEVVRGLTRGNAAAWRAMSAPDTRVGPRSAKGSGARVRRRPPASARPRAALVDRRGDSRVLARHRNNKSTWRGLAAVCRREAVGSPPRIWRRSRSSLEPSDGRLDSLPDKHLKASPHDQLPALAGDRRAKARAAVARAASGHWPQELRSAAATAARRPPARVR